MRSMTLEWHIPRPPRTAGGNCNPYANCSWERASGNRQAENKAQGGVVGAARMEVVAGRDLQALCSSPSLVQSLRASPTRNARTSLLAALRFQVHRRAGLDHPEGERLRQVQLDLLTGMRDVADGKILPDRELEIAAARRQHHRAVDLRGPNDGTIEEVLHAIANRVAVLCGLRQSGVAVRSERQCVGAIDAAAPQRLDRLDHDQG